LQSKSTTKRLRFDRKAIPKRFICKTIPKRLRFCHFIYLLCSPPLPSALLCSSLLCSPPFFLFCFPLLFSTLHCPLVSSLFSSLIFSSLLCFALPLSPPSSLCSYRILAHHPTRQNKSGVLAGVPFAQAVFDYFNLTCEWHYKEGVYIDIATAPNGKVRVATVTGECCKILLAERTALNILSR
jgi:hypothetical protein